MLVAEAGKATPESSEQLYQKARDDFYILMGDRPKQELRHNWTRCIDKFLKVYQNYPDHSNAYKAVFTAGRLYHKLFLVSRNSNDLDQALIYYKKLIDEFPAGSLTDDALYHQGELYREKKDFSSAAAVLEKLVKDYPKGDQAAEARDIIQKTGIVAKAAPPPASASVLVEKVSFTEEKNSSRIIVQTSEPIKYSFGRLSDPDRVYVNLLDSRLDPGIAPVLELSDKNVERVRIAQFDEVTSRLVIDLKNSRDLNVTPTSLGSRLVLEFSRTKPESAARSLPVTVAKASPVIPSVSPGEEKKKRVPLVVIDAGHGGKDLGAQSVNGLLEKDVNLKVSKLVKYILESSYNYQVLMTRDDDTFIPLDERGDVANEKEADVFISIHANAAPRRTANGIETYYLGIANSEQAQATAARENGELVKSVKDNQVQEILASLISTTKMNDSSRLAGRVQEDVFSSMKKKYSGVKDLGVKEGPFFVLHDTNMPSILVEIGFITNAREELRLRNSEYLNRLADSIARGIHRYLKDRGPTI